MSEQPSKDPGYKRGGLEPIPNRVKPCRDSEHSPPMHLCIPYGMQYRHICPSCGAEFLLQSSEVHLNV